MLREFGSQGLSNTAWAFASLLVLDSPLMAALAAAAMSISAAFHAQEIMNTAWAFSALRVHDAPLFEALSSASIAKIHGDMVNLGSCSIRGSSCLPDHDKLTPQSLSMTAWSFAVII
mmetsp:Transcript_60085/g.110493  ORF Transcript_60085/g.110493 Transcript_60085/m.110493 type:complete len:117 (-) Transcript_60085:12-362(-)